MTMHTCTQGDHVRDEQTPEALPGIPRCNARTALIDFVEDASGRCPATQTVSSAYFSTAYVMFESLLCVHVCSGKGSTAAAVCRYEVCANEDNYFSRNLPCTVWLHGSVSDTLSYSCCFEMFTV